MLHGNITHVTEHAEQAAYNDICHVMYQSIYHVVLAAFLWAVRKIVQLINFVSQVFYNLMKMLV